MKTNIDRSDIKKLLEIDRLIKSKNYELASSKLLKIDKQDLSDYAHAYYCILISLINYKYGKYGDILIKESIDILRNSDHNELYARAKATHGLLAISSGNFISAREILLEAYTSFLRCKNLEKAGEVMNRIGFACFVSGEFDSAINSYKKSIDLFDSLGSKDKSKHVYINLLLVLFKTGSINKSLKLIKSIVPTSIIKQENKSKTFLICSIIHAFKGDISKALSLIAKAEKLPYEFQRERAIYYEYLGWIYNLDEQYKKAEKSLNTGLEISLKIAPESDLISQTKRLLADSYFGQRKYNLAEKTARDALKVAEKINERAEIAACYRLFARIEHHRGKKDSARKWFKKSADLYSLIKSRYELAVTRYLMAVSGLYDSGERSALLYLAGEYFKSEDIKPWVDKIEKASKPIANLPTPSSARNVFIARHPKTTKIVELVEHVAPTGMTVLLTGPTGSGKDCLARFIHERSGRKGHFISVNAAAIPDSMIESELFGVKKGAFTGAEADRIGLFEEADRGTFYLNEIADSSEAFQAKLLETIENKTVRPLGGNGGRPLDIRFIAATNKDLQGLIADRKFRLDLYHRLNQIPIDMPPLADRASDIEALAEYFLKSLNGKISQKSQAHLAELTDLLKDHDWPGNVRQLRTMIERLYIMAGGSIEKMADIYKSDFSNEKFELLAALNRTGWNRTKAAQILGISEGTVRNRIRAFDLSPE